MGGLQNEAFVGKERRQIVEVRFVLGLVGFFLIHRLDFEQREKALLVLRGPDLAGDQVAGLQIEPANLRGRHINVLRARQIVETLRTQEAEAFGQHLQHAF